MAELEIISTKVSTVRKESGLRRYLSEKVFSKDGEEIGKVRDVIFTGYNVDGIITAKGGFFNKTFIGTEYIDKFTGEGIILKINPVTTIAGKLVFDRDGRMVGKVRRVNRKSKANSYDSLTVKNGIFGRHKMIYPSDVSVIQKNVILNVALIKNGK